MADFKNRYKQNHYDRVAFEVPKGVGEILTNIAKEQGLSRNKFIARCIEKETGLHLTLDKEEPWKKFSRGEGEDDK